jgi:DnaJ-class molecular chaperone
VEVTTLPPGEHSLRLVTAGYKAYRTKFTTKQIGTPLNLAFSFKELAVENIACSPCRGVGHFNRQERCNTCNGTRMQKCDYCEGRGTLGGINGFPVVNCHVCRGNRRVPCKAYQCDNGIYRWADTCTTCSGDGKVSKLQLSQ